MTKKDYEAIAQAFYDAKAETAPILGSYHVLYTAANKVADKLEADNARFDRQRFLAFCGFGEE